MTRFCNTCRHYLLGNTPTTGKCGASFEETNPDYLETGDRNAALKWAGTMRLEHGACGPDGKLWESARVDLADVAVGAGELDSRATYDPPLGVRVAS